MSTGHRVLAAFCIYLGASMLAGVGLATVAPGAKPSPAAIGAAQAVGLAFAAVAFLVFPPPATVGALRLRVVLASYLAFLCGWVPIALIGYPAALRALGGSLEPQPLLEFFADSPGLSQTLVVLLTVCLLAPLVEEIVFRGFLQSWLARWLQPWAAVGVASVVFGLFHGLDYAFPVALLGAWFGWLFQRTAGLAAPVAAHAIHNSTTVAVTAWYPHTLDWVYR